MRNDTTSISPAAGTKVTYPSNIVFDSHYWLFAHEMHGEEAKKGKIHHHQGYVSVSYTHLTLPTIYSV